MTLASSPDRNSRIALQLERNGKRTLTTTGQFLPGHTGPLVAQPDCQLHPQRARRVLQLVANSLQQRKVSTMTSQEMFEAMFDHTPMVDVRTPADVKAQKAADELR